MYRKLALTTMTANIFVMFVTLWVFVPAGMSLAKDLKVEMPLLLQWLISASNFASSPFGAVILIVACFAGLKALDKWATRRS
ncbi:MAG TPA: hypothetical protein VGB45_16070 [Abditibacterium sp.]|jgi:type II secretory pathway component PulF